jgi:SAM-dependent methyltransferase
MKQDAIGSGPGPQTNDGCSVELYRQLPYLGELDDVLPLFGVSAAVLELGCGTGRLSGRLAEAGCRVIGVDDSADMLAALPAGVTGVHSRIETLQLSERFDAVLLASYLINHPDAATRAAMVASARRHLAPGGVFIVQRHQPDWLLGAQPGRLGRAADLEQHLAHVARTGDAVRMTLRYVRGADSWQQSFTAVALSEAQVEDQLRPHGFSGFEWHGRQRHWLRSVVHS